MVIYTKTFFKPLFLKVAEDNHNLYFLIFNL